MGGYGHNLSNLLKNSRRKERKAYDGWTESDKESQGIKVDPISEQQLQEIRDKLKKQRKKERLIRLVVILSSICLTIIFFITFVLYFRNIT